MESVTTKLDKIISEQEQTRLIRQNYFLKNLGEWIFKSSQQITEVEQIFFNNIKLGNETRRELEGGIENLNFYINKITESFQYVKNDLEPKQTEKIEAILRWLNQYVNNVHKSNSDFNRELLSGRIIDMANDLIKELGYALKK